MNPFQIILLAKQPNQQWHDVLDTHGCLEFTDYESRNKFYHDESNAYLLASILDRDICYRTSDGSSRYYLLEHAKQFYPKTKPLTLC